MNDTTAPERPDAEPLPDPYGRPAVPEAGQRPREIGGRQGPDPTRYGDWEKAGRCVDF